MRLSLISIGLSLLVIWPSQAAFDSEQIYKNPLSNGFGEDIDWVKWDDAVEMAMDKNKPIFLLIHKSWCHACKSLKKTFQQSNARKAFSKLSKYFVMVNTEDDEEPYEEEYRPDGKYIPRLLFLDKNGDLLADFKNEKGEYKEYAYYYSTPADVLNSMKRVLKYYNIEVPELKRGDKLVPNKNTDSNEKLKSKGVDSMESEKKTKDSSEKARKEGQQKSSKEGVPKSRGKKTDEGKKSEKKKVKKDASKKANKKSEL